MFPLRWYLPEVLESLGLKPEILYDTGFIHTEDKSKFAGWLRSFNER